MFRSALGFVLTCCLLAACKNGEKETEKKIETNGTTPQGMPGQFKEASLPYQLTDTGLQKNTDTASLPSSIISPLIPDSIKTAFFGKNSNIRYVPLARLTQKENSLFYIVKAMMANKKAAFLLVYDNQQTFAAALPLLLPDNDPNTTQASTIDKNLSITKSITQRSGPDIIGEGKEVFSYDAAARNFSLIMTDVLNDYASEVSNPIDTFPKTNKWAGDYYRNKKNIVSVRDGRYANQLLVYVHTDNNEGSCLGELKGEFIMTSSTTAAYRQSGDPCVLNLNFKGNTVTIQEETGCGNYRGVDCPFTGTFTRKKAPSVKTTSKKAKGR